MEIENKITFFARLEPFLSPTELNKIQLAYVLAKFYHRAQKRKEIDEQGNQIRYFEHVRRVAISLMDKFYIFDPDIICSALMHDLLEDSEDVTPEMLEFTFGSKVTKIVKLLTKKDSNYFDNLKKSNCYEACLIKVADRYDNLTHLDQCSNEFIIKQIEETRNKIFPVMFDNDDFSAKQRDVLNNFTYLLSSCLIKVEKKLGLGA